MGLRTALTVIIPTYNRRRVLSKCLQALERQTIDLNDWEVVIVDDGSTDGRSGRITGFVEESDLRLRFFRQDHNGPAAARNLGIREASGELIIFIGDDIIATPNLLIEHLTWHDNYPEKNIAALGHVTWSKEIKITPFMRWLENRGPQFKYWSIKDKEDVSWRHLYTSNISFKKSFLLENGLFDENFYYAAYEDTELGFRLAKKGLKIMYNEKALAYHYHPTNLNDTLKRMEVIAESFCLYIKKTTRNPYNFEDNRKPLKRVFSEAKFELFKLAGLLIENIMVSRYLYSYLINKAKWRGLKKYSHMKKLERSDEANL